MKKFENFNGTITKQVVNSRKLNFGSKIRTLTISDLHSYTSDVERAERLAETIKQQEPNIIFIAGDLYNGGKPWEGGEKLEQFRKFVQNISEVAPVCITWGNHDLRGLNQNNKDTRLKNLYDLEDVRPGSVFPLYNDKVIVNGMEIVGFVPRFELMENEGLKTQIHGIAHDEFIQDYQKKGVKFENMPGIINAFLGHDPHLIAASENGIGLGDLAVCDFFVTGHLHDGYKALLDPIDKMKKSITGEGLKILEFDKGLVEQPTGVVDRLGNPIKGTKKLLGPTNLCRGIVYLDNEAQQKVLQLQDGKFYKNIAIEPNVQIWQPTIENSAREEILNNNLHFMLISEGIAPGFLPKEELATINVVDISNEDIKTFNYK